MHYCWEGKKEKNWKKWTVEKYNMMISSEQNICSMFLVHKLMMMRKMKKRKKKELWPKTKVIRCYHHHGAHCTYLLYEMQSHSHIAHQIGFDQLFSVSLSLSPLNVHLLFFMLLHFSSLFSSKDVNIIFRMHLAIDVDT